jgi:hypothetical protein
VHDLDQRGTGGSAKNETMKNYKQTIYISVRTVKMHPDTITVLLLSHSSVA